MKMLLIAVAIIACSVSLTVNAGQKKNKGAREEKTAIRAELLAKYDVNKDGKLDRAERAKITKEDKQRARKAGLRHKKHEAKEAK